MIEFDIVARMKRSEMRGEINEHDGFPDSTLFHPGYIKVGQADGHG